MTGNQQWPTHDRAHPDREESARKPSGRAATTAAGNNIIETPGLVKKIPVGHVAESENGSTVSAENDDETSSKQLETMKEPL